MYTPRLTKWKNPPQVVNTLFFACAVIDLLFDHTIDCYKGPALNTHTRSLELLNMATRLGNDRAASHALPGLIDEFESSVKDDVALSRADGRHLLELVKKNSTIAWTAQPLD